MSTRRSTFKTLDEREEGEGQVWRTSEGLPTRRILVEALEACMKLPACLRADMIHTSSKNEIQ